MATQSPYGSWESPWTLDRVAKGSSFPQFWVGQLSVAGDGLYALVRRPEAGGRSTILRLAANRPAEQLIPDDYNVNTRIIEYGGSAFVEHEGVVWFINGDQRWYRRDTDGSIRPITQEGAVRYGAPVFDERRNRIICVREDHRESGEPINTIVAVDADDDACGSVLVSGDDFYAWPALSDGGDRLAWVSWNHPHVPWDVTGLFEAQLDDEGLIAKTIRIVAEQDEVACDPRFTPSGELIFCTDRSGWWNYHAWNGNAIRSVSPAAMEFARPLWSLGMSDYRVLSDDALLGVFSEAGINGLAVVDLTSGSVKRLDLPYTYLSRLQFRDGLAYALASSPDLPAEVIEIDLKTGERTVLLRASDIDDVAGAISIPRHITFPSTGGRQGYGFYYPPANARFTGPSDERPPLLVFSHGGPTGCTNTCYNPGLQFWTSRGFAVLDINYAGSTGYGRAFRHLLRGGWGVVDVEDHCAGARFLRDQGLVDGNRLGVRGWSAGGYNTFACLAFADVFQAGASYFGISDIGLWAEQTHKLEAHYADYLIGPPESSEALYRERSPLFQADKIRVPLAMFQGSADKVTPRNQSELIRQDLDTRGVPSMYLLFEGEGHGFRKAETNRACFAAELAFFGRVFGFHPADDLPPITIDHEEHLTSGTPLKELAQ